MSARGSRTLVEELRVQDESWRTRPVVRRLYGEWYRLMVDQLSGVPGPTVELGSGISRFKEHYPPTIATDVEPTPWVETVVDAEALPHEDASLANLILVDVFHHLSSPSRFLDSAARVLTPGGRVVILDPYCSPVSNLAYRHFHHERTDLDAPPFADDPQTAQAPLAGNQARATLVFFRHRDEFERRWPELPIVERRRLALMVYPLSGGFTRPNVVPDPILTGLGVLERVLAPLAPLLAFRCLVVLERTAVRDEGAAS